MQAEGKGPDSTREYRESTPGSAIQNWCWGPTVPHLVLQRTRTILEIVVGLTVAIALGGPQTLKLPQQGFPKMAAGPPPSPPPARLHARIKRRRRRRVDGAQRGEMANLVADLPAAEELSLACRDLQWRDAAAPTTAPPGEGPRLPLQQADCDSSAGDSSSSDRDGGSDDEGSPASATGTAAALIHSP